MYEKVKEMIETMFVMGIFTLLFILTWAVGLILATDVFKLYDRFYGLGKFRLL